MNTTLTASILLASLIGVALFGRSVRRHLPDHHLSADSKDAVKLAMGLVATMTALMFGFAGQFGQGHVRHGAQRGYPDGGQGYLP